MADRLRPVGEHVQRLSTKEWKKTVHETIGLDIREDYYHGDYFKDNIDAWISDNVDLIKTLPQDGLDRMKNIIHEGYTNGRTTTDVMKNIKLSYGITKRHAQLIARDQTAKLNAQITWKHHKDAGVEKYRWSDSGDSRVRKRHAELHGHLFFMRILRKWHRTGSVILARIISAGAVRFLFLEKRLIFRRKHWKRRIKDMQRFQLCGRMCR